MASPVLEVEIQFVRTGNDSWDVIKYTHRKPSRPNERVYVQERVARVFFKLGRYVIDWAVYGAGEITWEREARSYLTPEGAFKHVTNPPPKPMGPCA